MSPSQDGEMIKIRAAIEKTVEKHLRWAPEVKPMLIEKIELMKAILHLV